MSKNVCVVCGAYHTRREPAACQLVREGAKPTSLPPNPTWGTLYRVEVTVPVFVRDTTEEHAAECALNYMRGALPEHLSERAFVFVRERFSSIPLRRQRSSTVDGKEIDIAGDNPAIMTTKSFVVHIDSHGTHGAIREELAGALQDAKDSGILSGYEIRQHREPVRTHKGSR